MGRRCAAAALAAAAAAAAAGLAGAARPGGAVLRRPNGAAAGLACASCVAHAGAVVEDLVDALEAGVIGTTCEALCSLPSLPVAEGRVPAAV